MLWEESLDLDAAVDACTRLALASCVAAASLAASPTEFGIHKQEMQMFISVEPSLLEEKHRDRE